MADSANRGNGVDGANGESVQSQHTRVIGWIRDRVIEGDFQPGQRIPEMPTCKQLGISRTPLREAFKVLAAERILTLHPNRGAVVTEVSKRIVDDAMSVMSVLEGFAGELLCAEVTNREIDELRDLTQALSAHYAARDLLQYFKVNQEIHRRIMEGSRNATLVETHTSLRNRFARYRYAGNKTPERWKTAMMEHEHILVAIEARDAALLGALLRSHVLSGWRIARDLVSDGEFEPATA